MSASTNASSSRVVTHPDGSIQVGDVVHKPWPSLAVLPARTFALSQEIIRADPGSPYHEFASRIPDYIRKLVRAMPNGQWGLLELAAANPKAGYRLLRDYPALAMMVVRRCAAALPEDRRTEFLRSMLALPLYDLLGAMGLPVRPRTLRILGMLPPEHCFSATVDRLMCVLKTPGHRWIHVVPHLPKLTSDGVSLLYADQRYTNPSLLAASSGSDFDSTPVFSTVLSVRQLLAETRRKEEGLFRGASFALLKAMEGRLYNEVHVDLVLPFPDPPIPGCPGAIEPIRDYASLVDEGEEQRHCVATMVGEVVRGEFYVYRLLGPTRATLVLQRGDQWQIHDIRGANNAEVSSRHPNRSARVDGSPCLQKQSANSIRTHFVQYAASSEIMMTNPDNSMTTNQAPAPVSKALLEGVVRPDYPLQALRHPHASVRSNSVHGEKAHPRRHETARKICRRAENRRIILAAKAEGCWLCGRKDIPSTELEFHHVATKKGNVADLVTRSTRALCEEIAKCRLICSAHHKTHHATLRSEAFRAGGFYDI